MVLVKKVFLDGGNVGIGTSSPASKLEVRGSGTSPIVYFGNGVDNPPNRQLAFSGCSSGLVWDLDATGASGVAGQLTLSTNGSEAMRIDSSGNLLVGTTTLNSGSTVTVGASGGGVIAMQRTTGDTSSKLGELRFGNTNVDGNRPLDCLFQRSVAGISLFQMWGGMRRTRLPVST